MYVESTELWLCFDASYFLDLFEFAENLHTAQLKIVDKNHLA